MNWILILIVCFLIAEAFVETWLSKLNIRSFAKQVPERISSVFTQEKLDIARNYYSDKSRLETITTFFKLALILALLFSGALNIIDNIAKDIFPNKIGHSFAFFAILLLGADILMIPFQWYSVFSIEQKYGFNKMTPLIFIADKIKSLIVSVLFGGIIFWLVFEIYYANPEYFWILAWLVIVVFSLIMTMFYSNIIVPLFNKQKPLEAGELRDEIEKFSRDNGFNLKNIYVINASKRSTKSNAYFTGIGPKKRIVLYDTLIEKHSSEEIVAVLAHEIGHYKKKHVALGFLFNVIYYLLIMYLLNIFLTYSEFAEAIKMQPSVHASLLIFILLFNPVSMLIGIFINNISRKHEFEADKFAVLTTKSDALSSALIKLYVDNLSNPTPHKNYVFVYYSHPPLLERLKAIDDLQADSNINDNKN